MSPARARQSRYPTWEEFYGETPGHRPKPDTHFAPCAECLDTPGSLCADHAARLAAEERGWEENDWSDLGPLVSGRRIASPALDVAGIEEVVRAVLRVEKRHQSESPGEQAAQQAPRIPDPRLVPTISVTQAGSLLGMSASSADRAARRGDLPTIWIGRNRRVPVAEFRRWLGIDPPVTASNQDGPMSSPSVLPLRR